MGKVRNYDFSDDDTDDSFDRQRGGKQNRDYKDIDELYSEAENYSNHRKKKGHRDDLRPEEDIA